MTLGASTTTPSGWSFRVWAPDHEAVSLRLYRAGEEITQPLTRCPDGYFTADLHDIGADPDYRYVLPDGTALADPASRWQPAGVHGPSRGFDPGRFEWTDAGFSMPALADTVIYELHVGTFTREGTFDAAIARLDALVDVGITAVEPMPVAAFPGTRNWGYDGVFPFAVQDSYGGPRGFQRFVDACHQRGLAVVLDVVYNHLGPEGNVLGAFGPYFTEVYSTPWGAAMNVAEAGSDEVRRYFTENALMWLRDFHVDGLRLDAIHGIIDPTASPFLRELTIEVARLSAELGRPLPLVAESADNNPLVISPPALGGLGFDAQWNDDFHHALHCVVTGEHDGYYQDFGHLDQLARAFNDGFAYQGEYSAFRRRRHGAPSGSLPSDGFVVYAQNHDQVGNRAGAERLVSLVEPTRARLATAALLLSPFVPLLFMGEEYGETAPFPYFIDHSDAELIEAVRQGRAEEFGRDADSFDPASEGTFRQATLDWSERDSEAGRGWLALHRGLLDVRRRHPVLTDTDPLESVAVAVDGVLILRRRSTTGAAFVALNFSPDNRVVTVGDSAAHWYRVIDSGDVAVGGNGASCPEDLEGAVPLTLAAGGFCLYVTTKESA